MMGLYFANEVTVDMGPTCIVPESQYYEVDRLHWSTLGTHKEPPALTTDPGRESWEAECSRVGRVMASADPAARDRMIERTGTFFGREQKKCTVPAGSMVFIHCPGRRGHLSAISVFLCKSVLYGTFVWARRVLNNQKRRFPARAVAADVAPSCHGPR